jgi:flagellar basal-body rod protein FlgB
MPISDIPILAMLRERMKWHQTRQQVLAENVANADTPGYQAKDITPLNFEGQLRRVAALDLDLTNPGHIIADTAEESQFATNDAARYEIKPRGNSVSHEDEMMNVATNQMDYEAVTQLYTHSLSLIKLAAGKE